MVAPRKRVHAVHIRRGPDGSAFQQCESCGLSVAIALADLHECGGKRDATNKAKTQCLSKEKKGLKSRNGEELRFQDQPRSAFRLFMEEFEKTCHDENEIDVDRRGFQTWRNMSKMERKPYEVRAANICSAYLKCLIEEENNIMRVNDEADSAEVRNYDEDSDGFLRYDSDESKSLSSYLNWKSKHEWLFH
ncbi:unnamed protein product [Cuscuta epithymum]|uniref:HMG box domain-containing protein n=1 Tax=Cuscuta epithymum TaxID=186058 RepID=A0AAV0FWK8_9ASTE|nr:unnamed protein product [Cuscuta epithymum]